MKITIWILKLIGYVSLASLLVAVFAAFSIYLSCA